MKDYKKIINKQKEIKEMENNGTKRRALGKAYNELKSLIESEGFEWIKYNGEKLATYTDQIEIIDFENNCLVKTDKTLTDLEKRMTFVLKCNRA